MQYRSRKACLVLLSCVILAPAHVALAADKLSMPAQLMFGNSDVNTSGSGLPLVALRALAMQASIISPAASRIPATTLTLARVCWDTDAYELPSYSQCPESGRSV